MYWVQNCVISRVPMWPCLRMEIYTKSPLRVSTLFSLKKMYVEYLVLFSLIIFFSFQLVSMSGDVSFIWMSIGPPFNFFYLLFFTIEYFWKYQINMNATQSRKWRWKRWLLDRFFGFGSFSKQRFTEVIFVVHISFDCARGNLSSVVMKQSRKPI